MRESCLTLISQDDCKSFVSYVTKRLCQDQPLRWSRRSGELPKCCRDCIQIPGWKWSEICALDCQYPGNLNWRLAYSRATPIPTLILISRWSAAIPWYLGPTSPTWPTSYSSMMITVLASLSPLLRSFNSTLSEIIHDQREYEGYKVWKGEEQKVRLPTWSRRESSPHGKGVNPYAGQGQRTAKHPKNQILGYSP